MIRVEVTKKQEPVRTEISVRMPSSSGTYEVLVKVDGETQIEAFTVDMAEPVQRSIHLTVEGTGTQTVDVYLDGVLYETMEMDFDALAE